MTAERFVDLHTHSTFSDGTKTPTELVTIATEKGLAGLALTDHDSLAGFPELSSAAGKAGIEVITGVEMSCEHNGRDLHVLGYGVDDKDDGLQGMLIKFREARENRGLGIVEKLREIGLDITKEEVLAQAAGGALGRPHIAKVLLEKKYVSHFGEAFDKYIGESCPAYVEKYKMNPTEAVAHIHDAGGLAFVAHPGYYIGERVDEDAFNELLDRGFDGIEVHHPHHGRETVERLLAIANARDLLISGGSDYHGIAGRDNLGVSMVPYELLERLKSRLAS